MNGDIEKACGCIMGIRYTCVKHCGGHAIPPDQDLPDGAEETAKTLVDALTDKLKEDAPLITLPELIRFRQGAFAVVKVFLTAADEEDAEPTHQ